jgi:eukaryotic-like serine/threonine-protein kinase
MNKDKKSQDIFSALIPNLDEKLNEEEKFPISDEILAVCERYIRCDQLGQGGMKKILACEDKVTSRQVAQARLHKCDDPELVELFFKEARLTAHLEHPNIMPLYDIGYDDTGEPYFTMKLIGGRNLGDLIQDLKRQEETVNYRELMSVFLKVCDAVAYAHAKDIIHLDLKPDNIRLGEFGEVLLCDWGLAKYIGDDEENLSDYTEFSNDATLHGIIKGTAGYMAPEQVDVELAPRDKLTDIYALGGVLYSLLCFERPVEAGDLQEVFQKTLKGDITPPLIKNPKAPKGLEAVSLKALSLERQNRYVNVASLQEDVKKWLDGYATSAEDQSSVGTLLLLLKRHKALATFLSILFISTLVFSVAISFKERQAVQALERYEKERLEKEAAGREAAPRLAHLSLVAFKEFDFESAKEFLEQAFSRDPDSEDAWQLKARYAFFEQDFRAAGEYLKKLLEPQTHSAVLSLVESLPSLPLDRLLTVQEFDDLYKNHKAKYDVLFLYHRSLSKYPLEDQLELCKWLLKLQNKRQKKLKFIVKESTSSLHLDLSGNSRLESLEALSSLTVTHLNLTGIKSGNAGDLLRMPLIELNISHCQLGKINELKEIKTLKTLILSSEQAQDFINDAVDLKVVISQ